jgi:hypothetical protein
MSITHDANTEQLCYICAEPIWHGEGDEDHVVPEGLFNLEDRQNLIKLPAHKGCNRSFSKDDEYFRLCMTAAASHNAKAKKLWRGPVIRGLHRPESQRFKASVLSNLVPADIRSEAGLYLGSREVMLQDAQRIYRVVNRIIRGLYVHRTEKILPADWPVSSDLMNPNKLQPFVKLFNIRFFRIGNETFLYGSKHLEDDHREALFWLVFYKSTHFWGYTGTKIRL